MARDRAVVEVQDKDEEEDEVKDRAAVEVRDKVKVADEAWGAAVGALAPSANASAPTAAR